MNVPDGWSFRHDRTGDTICGADGFRIPCCRRHSRGGRQHPHLYPCFSLIAMAIYNIETTRANRRKMNLVCGAINVATFLVFLVGISLHHSLYIKEGLYMMLVLFCMSVSYSIFMIVREMIRRKKMLETMAATDMLPYVRYSRASVFILCFHFSLCR